MRTYRLYRGLFIPTVLLTAFACSSSNPDEETGTPSPTPTGGNTPDPVDGVFESAHPSGANAVGNGGRGPAGTPTSGGFAPDPAGPGSTDDVGQGVSNGGAAEMPGATPVTPGGTPPPSNPNAPGPMPTEPDLDAPVDPARAIEEADIVKREGDRLYALSAYGGLSVIDISNPDALKVLGRYRTTATPFEMYVRDGVVFVLYNGYGEYSYDEDADTYTYYQTSYVVSLDTSDPKRIDEAQKFEISGYIADSRLVGDAMYVVAFDDSYCYRCGDTPETNVLSLNVSDPKKISKVDELTFPEQDNYYSWRRSLSGNDQRLYIAGPNYGGGSEVTGSVIQVVDITDPGGDMEPGDSIEVAGQINSRWQMDEHEGVLRVVSQPLWWTDADGVPSVETFEVQSADELVALGSTQLVLPRPETLMAVRFDGDRGYAITFERTDPLFTIDLSDPANPTQAGELEMPGWVYHMEPRGDRLVGLGYDQGNADGGLTVSLFDVSDLSTPTMIDRVNFGGEWGELAEDQDRIHKSFQVLDSEQLILVPFAGWSYGTQDECYTPQTYLSGVQLIDWEEDELTLRGVAPSQGRARRALLHEDRLLTMSDQRLEAFDIEDRNEPQSTSQVDLAQIVTTLEVAGSAVVRAGNDWWNNQELEVTVSTLDDLLSYAPGKKVHLPASSYTCNGETYLQDVRSGGDNVYFMYRTYDWSQAKAEAMKVITLDVSDVDDPKIAGEAELDFYPSNDRAYVPGMIDNGAVSVGIGDRFVFPQHTIQRNNLGFITQNDYSLEIVDFSDADEPQRTTVKMPPSLGSTGLLVSGNQVVSSHFVVSPTNSSNVRFYLDRVDLSDAQEPKLLARVNIPGSLLAYDAELSRALTVDYRDVVIENISPRQCYEEEFGTFLVADASLVNWEEGRGPCGARRFQLHLVDIADDEASLLGSYDVDKGVYISAVAMGDDRVFLGTATSAGYSNGGGIAMPPPAISQPGIGGSSIGYYSYPITTSSAKLLVASGLSEGELTVAAAEVEVTNSFYGFSALRAKGKKAVLAAGWQGRMSVIDASDADNPVVASSIELPGSVRDLELVGDTAVAALGEAGVQAISLASE